MLRIPIDWINQIRSEELRTVLSRVSTLSGDLLEIGGGSGCQAAMLSELGFRVVSIDIATSTYREGRLFPVLEYDGQNIPFPDETFDVLFSSNTLEHIPHLDVFENEMRRVLKPGGCAVHVLPTHHWRLWTWFAHYPGLFVIFQQRARKMDQWRRSTVRSLLFKALFPPRHGERGNFLTEYGYFHPRWWISHFRQSGWQVVQTFDVGLFYTGSRLAKSHLPFRARHWLGRHLGGSSHCYVLQKV